MKSAAQPHRGDAQDVITYYASSDWLYRLIWSPKNFGMHVGFWDAHTQTVDDAVDRENNAVMNAAGITKTSRVLDAGCGMGSTSIYIGKHAGASVTGVTLVPGQVAAAARYAVREQVDTRVRFMVSDYTHMPFPDNSFDAVVGIESVCHAYPKEAFLSEAYRVLKPGGRLVISDGYMRHPPAGKRAQDLYDEFCTSFALSELIDVPRMRGKIRKTKFRNVRWSDTTDRVVAGTRQLYAVYQKLRIALPLVSRLPFGWARSIARNAHAAHASMGLLTEGYGCYGIFIAVK